MVAGNRVRDGAFFSTNEFLTGIISQPKVLPNQLFLKL